MRTYINIIYTPSRIRMWLQENIWHTLYIIISWKYLRCLNQYITIYIVEKNVTHYQDRILGKSTLTEYLGNNSNVLSLCVLNIILNPIKI